VKHTRKAVVVLAAVACIVVVASVNGCSSSAGNTTTLAGAKQTTLELERQIAQFVPADMITDTQQTQTSKVIYPCLGKSDQSYWPGSETVSLKTGVKTDQVLSAIAANWTGKTGWSVFQATGQDGSNTLDMKAKDGYSFTVAFVDGPQLAITALSACFPNAGLAGKSSY
jgi:hypothetical protein